MCDRPSDVSCDEPDATVRHLHCDLRQRIDRFKDAKVVELAPRRLAKQQVHNDTCMEIARLTRLSTEAAGKYDDEGGGK